MDIQYLLFLQNFRENVTNNVFTPFLENLSLFAVTYLIMIPVFVYWAIDKKKGLYILVSYYLCNAFNAIVKLTACVYRPWIRDPRIVPAGDAITTATGYSFPSGHTVTAGPIYGGLAVTARKKSGLLSFVFVLLFLLTAFSRNYLGGHTPQDVLVGTAESILWLILMARLFAHLSKHPEDENEFLLASFVVGWIGILYITFKPYPLTYVDGALLVDPQKMMNDGYNDLAAMIVFPVARYIEKTWIRFRSTQLKGAGVVVSILALIPLWYMITYMKAPLDAALGSHWGHFMNNTILVFYCVCVVPAFLRISNGKAE